MGSASGLRNQAIGHVPNEHQIVIANHPANHTLAATHKSSVGQQERIFTGSLLFYLNFRALSKDIFIPK
jgi:hypothetical protein